MNITMQNKDVFARQLAEFATDLSNKIDDATYVNLLRVSEALERVGEIGSDFRCLADLKNMYIPSGEETTTNITYAQALRAALSTIAEKEAA